MGTRTGNATWQDSPSTATLITAATLEKIEAVLDDSILNTDPAVSQWVTSPFIRANINRALGSQTPFKMLIPVGGSYTVNQCAINVTTGVAAATATVTLYADDGTLRPSGTTLATSPTLDCSTTGVKTATFASPPVISRPGVWAGISFSDTTVQISWAEVLGPGTGLHTTVASLLSTTPLTAPENAAIANFYWVPRVALLRSA